MAHEFAELSLRMASGRISKVDYESALEALRGHELYSEEIEEQIEKYSTYVMEAFEHAKTVVPDPVLFIEEKLDFSHIVEEGFGTGDSGIIADGTMEVIDLKYGKGVKVEACENPQLKLYALGALRNYEMLYDIHTVRLTIIQPRIDNIVSWDISVKDLYKWAFEVVKPIAEKAYVGKGIQKAGEHCKFCLVKAMCNTLAQRNIALAKHEFKDPQLLTEKQLIDVVKKAYKKLTVKNSFILERGPYVLASVVDESEAGNEPLRLKGDYINLFSPELDYAGKVSIEPGNQAFLFNLREAYDRKRPHVIASASRIYDEKVSPDKYFRFVAKGPKDTKNVVCILLPEKSAKTIEVGCADSKGNSNLDYEMKLLNVSSDTGIIMRLLWVKTDNDPDGINFTIAWKK